MTRSIKWSKECRLGIDDIDSQHRLLFAIAGELDDIDNPKEQGPEIRYMVDHIRKYVSEHFQYEEKFMEKVNYPHLPEHRDVHKRIIEEVNHTLTSSKDLPGLKEQLEFLMNAWIKEHILGLDKQFAAWYASHKQ